MSDILVVGAGPVGLMTAILLARQGLRSTVMERFKTRHGAPKAHAINPRSLEICRAAGLDMAAMKQRATPRDDGAWVRFTTTLMGEEIGKLPYERQDDEALKVTPTPLINLAQPLLEDILLDEVARSPLIELRRGLSWVGCEQDADGVTSTIEDVDTRELAQVRTAYAVGADGAGSVVRRALGVAMVGDREGPAFITIHFEANLRAIVRDRPGILYWIMQQPHPGVLIAYDIDRRWCMLYPYNPSVVGRESFTVEVCEQIVRHAIGGGNDSISIKHILPWAMMSEVAERYRVGRVFLVGDAAHRFPPTGGLGLNTGLQDAHNLSWKIAAVEQGRASDRLLDSYHGERHAVAVINSAQSFKNAQRILALQAALVSGPGDNADALRQQLRDPVAHAEIQRQVANQRQHFDSLALQLGFVYGTDGARFDDVSDFKPKLVAGGRMPHAWLERNGKVLPLLDLLDDKRFTLLVGRSAASALAGAGPAMDAVKVVAEGVDFDDPAASLHPFVDLGSGQAVLVRPDGHVAAVIPPLPAAALRDRLPALLAKALCNETVA